MDNINYSWNEEELEEQEAAIDKIELGPTETLSTRNDLQIMRRLFHMFNGVAIATLYFISFSHSQMIHLLGTIACVLYLVEQIRINYPEKAAKFIPMTRFIIRAEEQLKESAMVPYAFAVLLTIITFPKQIALIGIYSLAIADPMSALIGIRFGKHKITANRTLEGSLAFFFSITAVSLAVLGIYNNGLNLMSIIISLLLGVICAIFETVPLKLDDNLTIPLFTSATLWLICTLLGISF